MTGIVEFLLARIDEDEAAAREGICNCGGPVCTVELGWYDLVGEFGVGWGYGKTFSPEHMEGLHIMALPFADHPDYDPAWKVC